jgi:hypothetical protein
MRRSSPLGAPPGKGNALAARTMRWPGDNPPVARERAHHGSASVARLESASRRVRRRVSVALADRLSPERTRRATWLERATVRRLSWNHVVLLNRYLAMAGKVATAIWVGFVASIVLGLDWEQVVQDALNDGKPIKDAFVLAVLVPTLIFLAARSLLGFWRWRLQRELWRRDVERLGAGAADRGRPE